LALSDRRDNSKLLPILVKNVFNIPGNRLTIRDLTVVIPILCFLVGAGYDIARRVWKARKRVKSAPPPPPGGRRRSVAMEMLAPPPDETGTDRRRHLRNRRAVVAEVAEHYPDCDKLDGKIPTNGTHSAIVPVAHQPIVHEGIVAQPIPDLSSMSSPGPRVVVPFPSHQGPRPSWTIDQPSNDDTQVVC